MPTGLSERQKSILGAVVREYVATAEPVASTELVRKRRLALSSATVRNEFAVLDEAGYLAQPHTSAGRVPTDKGYRFFIQHLASGDGIGNREETALRELTALADPFLFMRGASRLLAEFSHGFSVAGFPEDEFFYKSGIREVMREPEFADASLMHEFSALVDTIEDALTRAFDPGEFSEPKVFVGAENPIREARHYGMIVSTCETPFAKESLVAIVGPKRMNYEHNVALLKRFQEAFEE